MFRACVGAPGTEIENFSDLRNQRVGKENCAFPETTKLLMLSLLGFRLIKKGFNLIFFGSGWIGLDMSL